MTSLRRVSNFDSLGEVALLCVAMQPGPSHVPARVAKPPLAAQVQR